MKKRKKKTKQEINNQKIYKLKKTIEHLKEEILKNAQTKDNLKAKDYTNKK